MTTLELPEGVRRADSNDWTLVGDITAEAFAQNPVASWTFRNVKGMRFAFRTLARDIYIPRGICLLAEQGASMSLLPGARTELPFLSELHLALRIIRASGLTAINRALTAQTRMLAHRPTAPHLYLFTLGVLKQARSKGLGRKLMDPLLALADRQQLPAYLENSNPANTRFYESQKFVQKKIFFPGDGAPQVETMIRKPHP